MGPAKGLSELVWERDTDTVRRSLLTAFALLGVAAVVVLIVLFGAPSAGAAGGCGGG
jgi:hypothetical protein